MRLHGPGVVDGALADVADGGDFHPDAPSAMSTPPTPPPPGSISVIYPAIEVMLE